MKNVPRYPNVRYENCSRRNVKTLLRRNVKNVPRYPTAKVSCLCFEDRYEITWPVEICRNAAIQIPFEQISQNAAGPDEEKHIKY